MYIHSCKSGIIMYNGCITQNEAHGNVSFGGEHSAANGTFIHPLCGAVKLHGGGQRTSHTGSLYILGSPVAPYSLGVRLRMTLMAMHNSAVYTLPPMELLYTCCVSCNTPWRLAPYISHMLSTHSGKSRSALYTRCTIHNDAHGNQPLGVEHSAINAIYVHPLYGPVQLNGSAPVRLTQAVYTSSEVSAMHLSATVNALPHTELLYICCADLYSTLTLCPVCLPQAVCVCWELP